MLTVIAFFVLACLVLGWIVPLVIGIVRLRRRSTGDTAGMVLTIVGSVWGVVGLMLGVCGGMFWLMSSFGGPFSRVVQFDPSQHEGPMGAIVVPYEGEASLQVASMAGAKTLVLSSHDGRFQAPVGGYSPWVFTANKTDEDGSEWQASTYLTMSGKPSQVSVQADSETSLELGPPFTASIAVTAEQRNKVALDLKVADSQGNHYTISRLGLRAAPPPRFEVRSSSGELVLEGQFEYG